MSPILLRDATPADLPAIQSVYRPHVLQGLASFETEVPDLAELGQRMAKVQALGLPYLVAELDGDLAGYGYATPYRPRPAYRYTVEDSVYVRDGLEGRGIGRLLLERLIQRCETGGWRQMIAMVGNSENLASVGLHERLGFRRVGVLEKVGFKHGRWLDCVILQRSLGDGAGSLPGP
ncbi:GNAT family N-acetyltransferase [Pseudomonas sp. CR3202]|uniref:GNAT family N-acetyltransferase n=1 Tax=Pseudomonas sp. CR3202 TaxID=3351532 RepID=UPI003BF0EB05